MFVPFDPEVDFPGFFFLKRLDFVRAEFEDRAALVADEVVVMTPIQLAFESGLAFEHQGLSQTGTLQQFQRPIDRGSPDAGRFTPHEVIEIVHRKVFVRGQESTHDHVASSASVQALTLQVFGQNGRFVSKYSLH